MSLYFGRCSCAAVRINIELQKTLNEYIVRRCDCDFCMQRKISYLSEAGSLISISSKTELIKLQQGSKQAFFLSCSHCKSVVAATYQHNSGFIGAINAQLLDKFAEVEQLQTVSPKLLTEKKKIERWLAVWSNVKIALISR